MEIVVRDRTPDDLAMVFASWLKSWRGSKWAGVIPNHLYFETQRVLNEDLIGRGAKIVIAHPSGRPDIILGWACAEEKEGKTVLHYLYTKTRSSAWVYRLYYWPRSRAYSRGL